MTSGHLCPTMEGSLTQAGSFCNRVDGMVATCEARRGPLLKQKPILFQCFASRVEPSGAVEESIQSDVAIRTIDSLFRS